MRKVCCVCKIEKESFDFYKNSSNKDGRQTCCKQCEIIKNKKNKLQIKKYNIQYYKTHKHKSLEKYTNNRDYYILQHKKWTKENKEHIKEYRRKYEILRKKNVSYRIFTNLRKRISKAIRRNTKSKSTRKLINCSIEFLKKHLETQFQDNMTWNNYGEWHIDHIKPCASFDLSKPEEQHKCFHYGNLQPLWAKENLSKGSKYV